MLRFEILPPHSLVTSFRVIWVCLERDPSARSFASRNIFGMLIRNMRFTRGQLKTISAVLSNLAAGWLATIVIFPGIFGLSTLTEALVLLTYSISFAMLAMYLSAKIEDRFYDE